MVHVFVAKVTSGKEETVIKLLGHNVSKKGLNVYSAFCPGTIRGYIFIECESQYDAQQALFGIPYQRGLLKQEANPQEFEHFFDSKKEEITFDRNDIVEIISGPFKKDRAKIKRVDKIKNEVMVELVDSVAPIPITLPVDALRLIRKHDEETTETQTSTDDDPLLDMF